MHSDASYANLEDGISQSGMFIFLKGKNNLLAPTFWQSRKIQRLARSTLAAETLTFINGLDICVFIKHIFEEILGKDLPSISCFLDNKSLFEAAHSTKILQDRCLRVDIAPVRQAIHSNEIIIKWVKTQQQLS